MSFTHLQAWYYLKSIMPLWNKHVLDTLICWVHLLALYNCHKHNTFIHKLLINLFLSDKDKTQEGYTVLLHKILKKNRKQSISPMVAFLPPRWGFVLISINPQLKYSFLFVQQCQVDTNRRYILNKGIIYLCLIFWY